MGKPLISIVLPTYNVAGYIERCLGSCLSQSFENFEIIVVDDCGTDDSIQIASEYAVKDKRINIIHHVKNLGTYHARKNGTLVAQGNYILYLDPDDELVSGALQLMALQIAENPDLDLLLFNTQYVPELKFFNIKPKVPVGKFRKNIVNNILKEKNLPYGTMGKLYSKVSVMKGYSFLSVPESIRLVYGEDVLVFAGALLNVNFAIGISDNLYIYHINETSITTFKDNSDVFSNLEQLESVIRYLECFKLHPNFNNNFNCFNKSLEVSKIYMKSSIAKTNKEYVFLYLSVLYKDLSFRAFARFFISLTSLLRNKP